MSHQDTENVVLAANEQSYAFVLCDTCFWCATFLKSPSVVGIDSCPFCPGNKVSVIPITIDEAYRISLTPQSGLELEFFSRKLH